MSSDAAPWRPLPSLRPTAELPGPKVTERYAEVDGIQLYCVEAGEGRPLIFLHPLGWDHRSWEREIQSLSAEYRLIACDARGHGKSSKPPGPYSMNRFRDDFSAQLDALGIDKACIVGLSLGGMIAQYLAVQQPDRVAALVLVSTVCRMGPEVRQVMEERIEAGTKNGPLAAAQTVAKTLFSNELKEAEPEFLEKFYAWRLESSLDPIFDSMRATFGLDICASLGALTMPCMVVAGEADGATPPHAVAELAERIPNAEVRTVADCGHLIPLERPAEFTAILQDFLARHYPSTE